MKGNGLFYWLLLAVLTIGVGIGVPLGRWSKKCPEIRVGKETLLVTVVKHDTIQTVKTVSQIAVTHKIDTVLKVVRDSIKGDSQVVKSVDTANCYTFDETEKDGAYIKASLCSKLLPMEKPLDLTGMITYLPKPDTNRVIARVDTVMRFKETPPFADWKNYALVALAAGFVYELVKH